MCEQFGYIYIKLLIIDDNIEMVDRLKELGATSMCSVSILGKHLRKLASILTSPKTPKFTVNANILTLRTTVLALTIVSDCKEVHKDRFIITHQVFYNHTEHYHGMD